MAEGFGTSPFVLPNMFPAPGDVLQNEVVRRDRQAAIDADIQQRGANEQQRNELYNLNRIRQATDLSKYNDVEQHVDAISAKELQKIQEHALKNYTKLDPAQMEFLLSKDMQNFVGWHGAAKAASKQLNEGFKLYKEVNKNIDPKQAYDVATNEFLKDFIDFKNDGTVGYKDPMTLQPRDYMDVLDSPEVLAQLNVDTSPLQKALESIPKTPVGDKEYKSNRGFSHRFDWSGLKTDYSEIVEDERGRPKGFQLRTDRMIGDKKLIPNDLKEYLLSQPQVRTSVAKLWGQKKQELEAQGTKITPQIEGELFDMFLYDVANKHLPHDIKISEGQVTPKITNITNVNTSKNATPIDLTEYPDVGGGKKDITSLLQDFNVTSLITGDSFGAEQVIFDPNKKRISFKNTVTGKTEEMSLTTFLQNTRAQNPAADIKWLKEGLTNAITGQAQEQKKESVTYTIKGKKYTLAELQKMGYSESQVESYKDK